MRRGVLVKDGSALERLAEVDHVVFDKTGTLTLGEPRPVDLDRLTAHEKSVALALAQSSRHPLSRGLATALRALEISPAVVNDVTERTGEGVSGLEGSRPVALVRPQVAPGEHPACELRIGDKRIVIGFTDPLRPDVAATVAALAGLGLKISILSGDAHDPVAAVAKRFGLPFVAGVQPAEKLAFLADLERRGERVLMVGDGLNDGPALAAAHVSMAPAGASDVSRQAADAVFLGDSLMPVADAVRAARRTMRTVRQNFTMAVGYNVIAVPVAVAGLVTPLIAAVAMSLSSLIVVGNSLRLTRGEH
jgi:Cu2+-exporting ATPase